MAFKLSDHTFIKGKFITPYNEFMTELSDEKSWTYGRLPEYLWIGLILDYYGRKEGLKKLYSIVLNLHSIAPNMFVPRISDILNLDEQTQALFYEQMCSIINNKVLSPLTLIYRYSNFPVFAEFFSNPSMTIDKRQKKIFDVMKKTMGHQTYESTDIRFVVLYFWVLSGKLHMRKEENDLIYKYPCLEHEEEEMRMIRPSVRSLEALALELELPNSKFIDLFWKELSMMSSCALFIVDFPSEKYDVIKYSEQLHEIFSYLTELFVNTNPLDEKMNVVLGIATYSYKRFKEMVDHNLYNSISGRGCVRCLIENYIMIKYLLKIETSKDNVWKDFQDYGIGQYKLILSRYRDKDGDYSLSHFDTTYIEAIVNEFKIEECIDMDTNYFDKRPIRLKAEDVDEKELYGLYYDYDSAFEHGLWGAIRESSLVKCNNPSHQYHCVPDADDNVKLKSVLHDSIMIINKTVAFLNDLYGLPDELYRGVIGFEVKHIDE